MLASVKLIGGMLIVGSGAYAAYLSSRAEQKKLTVLDGWLELLFYIREQIECFLTPQSELLRYADKETLKKCIGGGALPARDLKKLLDTATPHLDNDSRQLLSSFLAELGSSYREEQVRRCDQYLSKLQRIRGELASELPKRIRLNVALRLCASLGITVLLW